MFADLDPVAVVALQWTLAMGLGWTAMVLGRRGLAVNTSFVGSASARTAQVLGTLVFFGAMIGLAGWLMWLALSEVTF